MKARVKATGEIVDVVFESSYVKDGVSLWTDGKKEYSKDSLDFIDSNIPSEQRMRYELIKAAIQGIISNSNRIINGGAIKENSNLAISYADEIIKQLKKL